MHLKRFLLSASVIAGLAFSVPAVAAEEADLCRTGKAQSPISISQYAPADLPALALNYKPTPLDMVHTGDTVQMYYEAGSSLEISGKSYRLWQVEFYTPSEHYMNGAPYPMEMQFVHQDEEKNLAIVSVFVKLGAHNKYLQGMWDNIPAKGRRHKVKEIQLSAQDIMPEDKSYYTYKGSLTRSPCLEGVNWYILKESIEMSAKQLMKFEKMFPRNARSIQPLNGRTVKGAK